jgi:hypothetical protein
MSNYNQPIIGLKTDFVQKSIDVELNKHKFFTKLALFRHFAANIVYLAS